MMWRGVSTRTRSRRNCMRALSARIETAVVCRRVFDPGAVLRPWFERAAEDVPGLAPFDAHTHVGANDPDGFKQTPDQLLAALAPISARALVFPMHEPNGYPEANDAVLERVRGSRGVLRALCRVQPKDPGAVAEARRCLDAGASGIKLHPRAEQFTLSEPSVRDLVAAAHERRATVRGRDEVADRGLGERELLSARVQLDAARAGVKAAPRLRHRAGILGLH